MFCFWRTTAVSLLLIGVPLSSFSYSNYWRLLNIQLLYYLKLAEAIDKWFEDLSHYEQTLEDMAVVSLDTVFKEELSTIESWFRNRLEAERTAALYSLLQHSSQVQIRFFITVLQQMAKKDPVGALLSPTHTEKGKCTYLQDSMTLNVMFSCPQGCFLCLPPFSL